MIPPKDNQYVLFGGTFVLANKLQSVGDRIVEGLSTKQWFLLRNLMEMSSDPPPTITQVAQEIDSTRQNVTKMLESMEREGLVTIEKNAIDHRSRNVRITSVGLEYANQAAKNAKGFMDKLFAQIEDAEKEVAASVLIKMVQNLEKMQKESM